MKNLTLKKAAAAVLVLLLGLVAGDVTLRGDNSDVKATVEKVKAKVEALLEDDATEATTLISAPTSE